MLKKKIWALLNNFLYKSHQGVKENLTGHFFSNLFFQCCAEESETNEKNVNI